MITRSLQRHSGRSVGSSSPGLRVSSPLDRSEREADTTATRILAMPTPNSQPAGLTTTSHIQRCLGGCNCTEEIHRQPEEEDEEELQLKPNHLTPTGTVTTTDIASLGTGQSLPKATRSFFEPRFGADLSQVRIHTNPRAGHLAHQVGAKAFTYHQNIAFAPGHYQPDTTTGKHLLAHELTHTIQQKHVASVLQRSRALFISTRGRQRYLRYAADFHRQEGTYPEPVDVSSVEEMLGHMTRMSRPIEWVRLVTHAVPDGIFLPLFQGGGTSLFQHQLNLQREFDLERELATEHRTVGPRGRRRVVEIENHVAPESWVYEVWKRAQRSFDNAMLLHSIGLSDSPRHLTDAHSFFWWIIDRELVNTTHEVVQGRRTVRRHIVARRRDRDAFNRFLDRNIAIFRNKVIAGPWAKGIPLDEARIAPPERSGPRTPSQANRLETIVSNAARTHIREELTRGLRLRYSVPDRGSEPLQGALERGTYADNLLRVKYSLANGSEFQIRGCNIGQNVSWLQAFRDFLGHGEDQQRSRPHVSAPDIRQVYAWRRRGRGPRRYYEYLLGPRGRRIFPGTRLYESHFKHAR